MFTIHKIPTRVSPSDLSTTRFSVKRREVLSVLCGLCPFACTSRGWSRTVHHWVASKLAQALQVISISLLPGCSLRGERALQDYMPLSRNVVSWTMLAVFAWRLDNFDLKMCLVAALTMVARVAVLCSMSPGGFRRDQQQEGASRSWRRSGDRREEEDRTVAIHKKVALFMPMVEGNVPREPVTDEGMCKAMIHLLAASRDLDDGYYFVIADALGYLDTGPDHRAKELFENVVKRHIRTYDIWCFFGLMCTRFQDCCWNVTEEFYQMLDTLS